jgi:acetyl esterase
MPSRYYPTYVSGDLHPDAERVVSWLAAGDFQPLDTMTPAQARDAFVLPAWLGTPRPGVAVRPVRAGSVPVRLYTPAGPGPWPVLVYCHGGGFVVGRLDEFEPLCTFFAEDTPCLVVSVDYRLAPEHPYPAAAEDAWEVLTWVARHIREFGGDPARIAVAGDSAGGNLAAGLALRARDAGGPGLVQQTLICPWLDLTPAAGGADSFRHFGDGPWLSRTALGWYQGLYLAQPGRAGEVAASPLLAESLAGLPPALVVLAEFDILADQGRAWAGRLAEAGVPVQVACHRGMVHDFVMMPELFAPAWAAIGEIAGALATAFATQGK